MSGLHQLNVRYEPVEDRVVFNVKTADGAHYRVWLTRRYTRLLIGLLEAMADRAVAGGTESDPESDLDPESVKVSEPPSTATETHQVVKSFQRETALSQVDFSTEFQEGEAHYPLGEQPLLASRIDYRSLDNGALSLTLVVSESQGVNLVVDQDLLFGLIKLLEEVAAKAEWDLAPTAGAEQAPLLVWSEDTVVH